MVVYDVMTYLDIPFIQMCQWERFSLAAPTCKQNKEDKFESRPYVRLLGGYGDLSKNPTESGIPSVDIRSWAFTRELPAVIEVDKMWLIMGFCHVWFPLAYNAWRAFLVPCLHPKEKAFTPMGGGLFMLSASTLGMSIQIPTIQKKRQAPAREDVNTRGNTSTHNAALSRNSAPSHDDVLHIEIEDILPSTGAGCSIRVATPATPRTSPPPVASVTEIKGGKFWESTFLESESIIVGFLDRVGELILKAKVPNNLSFSELEAMRKVYDDCVKIKFDLDFMGSTRDQMHNVIVALKYDPAAELAEVDIELAEIDAREKELKSSLSKLQRQRNSVLAKQQHVASRDSLNAFHQGASFFP
ncbi:hypothetical protein COLO4_37675 [Corchorus olitorius]|uniref:Uncharacterized protein n=1 Tax=Corchorus olitorius TaxID=93759 RepID=A0A1R3G007_9ROSI|nr:hypothetical protein COLO4_37675 [Corchorus olitorius]